jgi:hypothetical protein
MSTYAVQDKITIAEAQQWLLNAHEEWTQNNIDSLEEEELHQLMITIASLKPEDFKVPRRKSSPKKKSSNSERSQMEYDESQCDARCWAGGFGAQCSKKKIDGSIFCKTCNKDNKDGNKVGLRNGLFTETRPTHEWADESNKALGWRDADGNKPEKKKSSKKSLDGEENKAEKKTRKCGYCRCEGHTKATCPEIKEDLKEKEPLDEAAQLAAALALVEKLQAKGVTSDASSDDDDKTQACEIGTDVANLDDVKDEGLEEDLSPESESAAGVGEITQEPVEEDPVEEVKKAKGERVNKMDQEGGDLVLDAQSSADDGFTDCSYEGVKYDRDPSGIVYDLEMDEVGNWDGEKIEFGSKVAKRNHCKSRNIIQELDEDGEDDL